MKMALLMQDQVDQVGVVFGVVAVVEIFHLDRELQVKASEADIHYMLTEQVLLTEALAEPEVVAPAVLEQTVLIQILAPVGQERNGLMAITMLVAVVADFVVAVEPTEA
jgi:hypothetical protein